MKKPYSKPLISVEVLTLDEPIAANCKADFDDMQNVIDLGYWGANDRNITCDMYVFEDDTVDWTGDGVADGALGHDTICYHSNVQTPFLS